MRWSRRRGRGRARRAPDVLEILTAMRRAGADMIISYHAKDAAQWLAEQARMTRHRQAPQPQGRRGHAARRSRPQAAQPPAGQLPDECAALPAVARACRRSPRNGGDEPRAASCFRGRASSARSRRSLTRGARLLLDARGRQGRPEHRIVASPGRSTSTPASRTTTCATTSSTCGSRSPSSPTRVLGPGGHARGAPAGRAQRRSASCRR
jgi:hypothetical protein